MDKSLKKLAVLYADVSDSTRLYEQYGDAIARADMAQCIDLLQDVAKGLSGETLQTIGDEIMVAFAEPVDPAGLTRQEVAAEAQRRVATLLGLPNPGRALPRGGDRPA